jgi:hypothetical protein
MLDASQKPHWRVPTQILIELHCVQVFDSDPSEDGPAICSIWLISKEEIEFLSTHIQIQRFANLAFSMSEPQRPTSCRTKSVNVF